MNERQEMLIHRLKFTPVGELAHALQSMKRIQAELQEPQNWEGGLCKRFGMYMNEYNWKRYYNIKLEWFFDTWEHWSGSYNYPIRMPFTSWISSNSKQLVRDLAHIYWDFTKGSRFKGRGRLLRLKLLQHCIAQLEAYLKDAEKASTAKVNGVV